MYRVWGRFGSGGIGEGVSVCVAVVCREPEGVARRGLGPGGGTTALGVLAAHSMSELASWQWHSE